MNIDFNLHCLPGMDYEYDNYDGASHILNYCSECYIKRAVLAPGYDAQKETVISFLKRRNEILKKLRTHSRSKPKLTLIPAATVRLISGITNTVGLNSLCVDNNKTNYLYISLPFNMNASVIDSELHNILYKHHMIPVFTNFDVYSIIYSPTVLYKIMKTPYAVFQFNVRSLRLKPVIECIKILHDNKKTIVFGSGINEYSQNSLGYDVPGKIYEKVLGKKAFRLMLIKNDNLITP